MQKRNYLIYFSLLFLTIVFFKANAQKTATIKIACVGNSITYGSRVANREKNAYPDQLQELLGNQYVVRNFGVSGRTLLKKGNHPYWETEAYQNALQFKPDVVYIKLGTNDSKQQNRIYLDEFEANYEELINNFKKQNNNVRVVILLPVPSFVADSTAIWNPIIKNKIIPKLQKVAYKTNVEILDLYQLFIDQPELLPDKIHPNSLGATVIAKRLYENMITSFTKNYDLINNLTIEGSKESNFYGFQQYDFKYKGIPCKIVKPKRVLKEKPWVWRARFWGHEPQTDIALLERGFHIVYCDVSDLYGAKTAVKRWNKFYRFLRKGGLSSKVVLEGMSRGGLIVYNWAAKNSKKVACIYADAPVLDGKSWPGGLGKGEGYSEGWELFKELYRINNQKRIQNFSANPIYKTKKIAKAGYPILHVCGEADKVVPVEENTRIFEQKIKKEGGNIAVIYKDSVGHHPHSLENPKPIVDFILRALGYKINFAAIVAPGSEYRSAAGWKEGKGWWYQMNDIDSLCRNSGKIDLLLIGNSITQGWGGSRTLTTYGPGQKSADKYFNDIKWISAGISGDRTQHILWRVKNGHYEACEPDFVTLAIGVNNFADNTAEEIAKGIEMNINLVREKLPNSKILFYGPLPTGIEKNSDRREKYTEIHHLVSHLGNMESVYYYNMIEVFVDKKGNLNSVYYRDDGIHFKNEGYNSWAKHIRDQMEKLK